MREDFISFLWKYRLYANENLHTTEGASVFVYHPGQLNEHSGPDFSEAEISIGSLKWSGHVEIHVLSSEWNKHAHQHDLAYDNVILHVVNEEDDIIFRRDGSRIPCLQLKGRIQKRILESYRSIQSALSPISCSESIDSVSKMDIDLCFDRVLIEKLEERTKQLLKRLHEVEDNWEQLFYERLCRNFGFKVNGNAFENLARKLPFKFIKKEADDIEKIEALIFGVSGFLNNSYAQAYFLRLKTIYAHLKKKYSLKELNNSQFKYMRMRPSNFPTMRLAQLAALIYKTDHLFNKVMNISHHTDAVKWLNVEVSRFWKSHYHFNSKPKRTNHRLGAMAQKLIIANAIVQLQFSYASRMHKTTLKENALGLLESIPAEKNIILKKWNDLGIKCANSARSQGAIHLFNKYCANKKCLNCQIGKNILKQSIS